MKPNDYAEISTYIYAHEEAGMIVVAPLFAMLKELVDSDSAAPNAESFFPEETLAKMQEISIQKSDFRSMWVAEQLGKISEFDDLGKKNRWFGYYQRAGELFEFWTLGEVITWVREEREQWESEQNASQD